MTSCLEIPVEVFFHLSHFLSNATLILLAASCRHLRYCLLNYRRLWRMRYLENFRLDDHREREWYIWYTNKTRKLQQQRSKSQLSDLDDDINWYDAFIERCLTEYNWQQGRCSRQTVPLPDGISFEGVWIRAVWGGHAIIQLIGCNELIHVQYPHIARVRNTHLFTTVWATIETEETEVHNKYVRRFKRREHVMLAWLSGIRRPLHNPNPKPNEYYDKYGDGKLAMLPGWSVKNIKRGMIVHQWMVSFSPKEPVRLYHLGRRRWCQGTLKSVDRTVTVLKTSDDAIWIYSAKKVPQKHYISWQVWEFNITASYPHCVGRGVLHVKLMQLDDEKQPGNQAPPDRLSSQRGYNDYIILLYRLPHDQQAKMDMDSNQTTSANGNTNDDDSGRQINYVIMHSTAENESDEITWLRDDLNATQVGVAVTARRVLVQSSRRALYILDIVTGDTLQCINKRGSGQLSHLIGNLFYMQNNQQARPIVLDVASGQLVQRMPIEMNQTVIKPGHQHHHSSIHAFTGGDRCDVMIFVPE
ncbi:hypothetical protein BDF19DRAFT_423624 [Syncephalis fuscata]|nr:hypothetical protein BDF19DRAFT_423624 [Syncephalis fuscata]